MGHCLGMVSSWWLPPSRQRAVRAAGGRKRAACENDHDQARRENRKPKLDDRFHETCVVEQMIGWRIPCFAVGETRSGIMAGWRRAVELAMTDEEIERLTALSRSRTEPASRVSRAQMLLAYRENPSFCAVGQRVGVHHQTVQRCVERASSPS